MKPISLLYIIFLILIQFSCGNNIVSEPTPNSKVDYININKEISQNKLDKVSGEYYTYWMKNNEIVKLYILESDRLSASHKEFYFKNKKIIAYQLQHMYSPNNVNYTVLLFINKGEIVNEEFWIENIKKNKKSFLKYFRTIYEKFINYKEYITKDVISDKFINDLTMNEVFKAYNIAVFKKINKNENTIKIGEQEWLNKNLDVSKFRNGDIIPEAKTDEEWKDAALHHKPAWCYYNYDPNIGRKMGKLYNWYAVKDSRGLAPKGYHIASAEEFNSMIKLLGYDRFDNKSEEIIASKLKKNDDSWINCKNKSNESGFSALPNGWITDIGGFYDINERANFWTSSGYSAYFRNELIYRPSDFTIDFFSCRGSGASLLGPGTGMAVRCIKGESDYNKMSIPIIESLLIKYDDKSGEPLEGKIYSTSVEGILEKNYVNGLQNGKTYLMKFKDGKYQVGGDTLEIWNYKNGVLDGEYINYRGREHGFYKNGKKEGKWVEVYGEYGKYINGEKEGVWVDSYGRKSSYKDGEKIKQIDL